MLNSRFVLCGCVVASLCATSVQAQPDVVERGRTIKVNEELWLQLSDEPGRHIQSARDRFFNNDRASAALHMRKAAVFLKISAQNATEKTEQNLRYSVSELESPASGVESGTVSSIRTLEHAFSRAEHAMAQHHYALAS